LLKQKILKIGEIRRREFFQASQSAALFPQCLPTPARLELRRHQL